MEHKWKFLEAHTIGFLSWLHLMKSSEHHPTSLASESPGKDGSWFLNTSYSRVLCPCQTLAAFALWMAQHIKHYSQSMYIDNPKLSSHWLDILDSGLTFILRTKITITRLAWPNWQSHTWFPRPVNLIMIPQGEALWRAGVRYFREASKGGKGKICWGEVGICLQCRRPWFDSWVGKICWRRDSLHTPVFLGFPCGSAGKEYASNAGDLSSMPGLGRSPGEGKG